MSPVLNPGTLQARIAKGDIKTLYLFQGPEDWLKDRAVARLKEKLFAEGGAEMNMSVYDAAETSAAEIVMTLQTAPFLAPRRLVVVRFPEKFKLNAADSKLLAGAIEDVPPFSCVVLLYSNRADRRDAVPSKVPEEGIVTFWPPFPSRLPAWIQEEASRHGKRVDPAAAERLAELFPEGLQELASEIEKLALLAGDSPRIGLSEVEAAAAPNQEADPWDVDDAVQNRDLPAALKTVGKLTARGLPAEKLLPGLERVVRLILCAKVLAEQGIPLENIPAQLGIRGRTREENLKASLRRYARAELETALLRLERSEWDVKTGALPGEMSVSLFLRRLLLSRQGVN